MLELLQAAYSPLGPERAYWKAAAMEENQIEAFWSVTEQFPDFEYAWRALHNVYVSKTLETEEEMSKKKIIDDALTACRATRIKKWLREELPRRPFDLRLIEGIFEHHNELIYQFITRGEFEKSLALVQEQEEALQLSTQFYYPHQNLTSANLYSGFNRIGANTDLRHSPLARSSPALLWASVYWALRDVDYASRCLLKERQRILNRHPESKTRSNTIFEILWLLWLLAVMEKTDQEVRFEGEILKDADCRNIWESPRCQGCIAWMKAGSGCASKSRTSVASPMFRVLSKPSALVCIYCAENCYRGEPRYHDGLHHYAEALCSCDTCL